jgi:hypothetical protein
LDPDPQIFTTELQFWFQFLLFSSVALKMPNYQGSSIFGKLLTVGTFTPVLKITSYLKLKIKCLCGGVLFVPVVFPALTVT